MNKLLERMKLAGVIKEAEVLADSYLFTSKDITSTEIPILNLACSGDLKGGLSSGVTVLAGLPKSYKTLLGLYCMKAYLNKHKDGVGVIYDSEFSITPDYLKMHDIDPNRILHVPIVDLEMLKFDIMQRLKEIKLGDKVFILIDSLGTAGSKKEIEDALKGKSPTDMTRAKGIRSIFRMITPPITMKDIPCVVINHVYKTLEIYSKLVVSGGEGPLFNANQVFIITRAQDKEDDKIKGYFFTINVDKSRFVKEKSKFPLHITYDEGIDKWSGLLDIALETGFLAKQKTKPLTYSISGSNMNPTFTEDELAEKGIWQELIEIPEFCNAVSDKYKLKKNET
jgi:hypothetical protein